MREITLSKAVNEAIAEEMRRDPTVFLIGEDVAEAGTPFKVLAGLVDEFGTDRVIDTPISEPGFVGMAVGAALTGSRPIVDLMFGDFIFLVMDQLCNQAAKACYMSGGKLNVPMVLRTNLGATRRSAAQHSQSLHALVAHIPGLKVAMPSSAYEAKGLMKTAIRDNNPVVIFEDKLMYQDKAPVPEGEYLIPFGKANIKREGTDITLIGTSSMVQVAEKAADLLAQDGISAEVIDPRTIVPLDEETILASVRKTSRAIVIDEGHQSYGVTGEIASRITEKAFYHLDAPVLRMGAMDVPVHVATEDGTAGTHGLVTEPLREYLKTASGCALYSCGPTPMMRAVDAIARERELPHQVSLEAPMACGIGVCLSCVVPVATGDGWSYRRICREGPVFDAGQLLWEHPDG